MSVKDVIIIGAGPCGLAAAIACQENGLSYTIFDKGNIVNALSNYPTHQTFFSTSEKLEIGDVPFISPNRKPTRNESLVYYREVVKRKQLTVTTYHTVYEALKYENHWEVKTKHVKTGEEQSYYSKNLVLATGYYDHPNLLHIPGEHLPKVFHYFKEGHDYFNCDVVVIGGKNSAVDAALELNKCGANVTCLYRGETYSTSVKPWILPEFQASVRSGEIKMEFQANILEIDANSVTYEVNGERKVIKNDFVFAMTGYHPDHSFIRSLGVTVSSETGRPYYDEETMETNVSGVYIAGVLAAGNNANEIFIENGRFHGEKISKHIMKNR